MMMLMMIIIIIKAANYNKEKAKREKQRYPKTQRHINLHTEGTKIRNHNIK